MLYWPLSSIKTTLCQQMPCKNLMRKKLYFSDPEFWVLEVPWRSGFKRQVWTRLFFILCQIFGIFDDFQRVEHAKCASKLWKIVKYATNLAKNEEKPCSICLLKNDFESPISLCTIFTILLALWNYMNRKTGY